MKYIMTLLMVLICSVANAYNMDMNKIAMIESSGNPRAYNPQDGGRGLYQITAICLKEYNAFHPQAKYFPEDLWNITISNRIANWYINKRIPQMLKHYRIADTPENRIVAWNAGIGTLVKGKQLPRITKDYIKKYNGGEYAKR